jgi:hypothetical protein
MKQMYLIDVDDIDQQGWCSMHWATPGVGQQIAEQLLNTTAIDRSY